MTCLSTGDPDFDLELTRFGGHLNTWDHKSRMKEVNRADEVHQALSIGVPD